MKETLEALTISLKVKKTMMKMRVMMLLLFKITMLRKAIMKRMMKMLVIWNLRRDTKMMK